MRSLLVAVLLSPIAAAGHATTLSLQAQADNTLYESPSGARSNGIGQHLFAGRTAESDSALRRGLVRFDVGAILPTDATVLSATLVLHLSNTSSGPRPVRVHRLLGTWGEGTSDAPLQEGSGTTATPGDATWIHRVRPSLFWASPGGDFAPGASASTDVAGVGDYAWSSSQLAADVQAWITNPATDFGWILIGEEGSPSTSKRFDSRENPNPAVRPRLLVQFEAVTDTPSITPVTPLRAYPNPFRDRIAFSIDPGSAAESRLEVFDPRGRRIRRLTHSADGRVWFWDGHDASGIPIPAGVYFVQLRTRDGVHLQRLVRLPSSGANIK